MKIMLQKAKIFEKVINTIITQLSSDSAAYIPFPFWD